MGSFNALHSEIVSEILTRVPTESVLQCKSVCKPWRNLIRQPSFAKQHLTHLKNNNLDSPTGKLSFILLTRNDRIAGSHEFYYTAYDDKIPNDNMSITRMKLNPKPFKNYEIVGSQNGLICLSVCYDYEPKPNTVYRLPLDYEPTYICNPITREFLILPRLGVPYTKAELRISSGFGYCPSTGEYKVVRISRLQEASDVVQVEIYTLGSGNEWRYVGTYEEEYSFLNTVGVFANGALHWIAKKGRIVAFNLANERFHEISLPPLGLPSGLLGSTPILLPDYWFRSMATKVEIGVLNGYLMCFRHGSNGDVWLLKKTNDAMSWKKKFHFVGHEPFALTENGAVLCFDNTNGASTTLCSYDSRSSSLRILNSIDRKVKRPISHMNTLVSLKGLGEENTETVEST